MPEKVTRDAVVDVHLRTRHEVRRELIKIARPAVHEVVAHLWLSEHHAHRIQQHRAQYSFRHCPEHPRSVDGTERMADQRRPLVAMRVQHGAYRTHHVLAGRNFAD